MIKIKTKKEIREELEKEVSRFLSLGGSIKDIEQGASGKDIGVNLNHSIPFTQQGKQTRTLLTDEVNALDERKKSKRQPLTNTSTTPKKKMIYDDFGEPLREVWE